MKPALRVVLLVLALIGFLFFFSFNIENLGPKQTVTVGFNISPWLTWSRIKGIGEFGKKVKINFLSWSAAGLVAGVVLLALQVVHDRFIGVTLMQKLQGFVEDRLLAQRAGDIFHW